MPIFTPRGLKIRLDPVYAFTLLARLEPRVHPIEVLKTTEAVENAPALAGIVAAVIAIGLQASEPTIFWATLITSAIIGASTRYGIFIVPGLIPASKVFSRFSGWGVFLVGVVILAWMSLGWTAAVAYVAGRVAATTVNWFFEVQRGRYYFRVVGEPLTGSEINFFSAYRLHAQAIGESLDVGLEDEAEREKGKAALLRFAEEYPGIAVMFS